MGRAIIDCDGPCAGFTHELVTLLQQKGHADVPNADDIHIYDFIHNLLTKEQKDLAYEILNKPDFWANQSRVPGSLEAVEAIRAAGHHAVWATAPWIGCFGWADVRREWLYNSYKANHKDVVISASKHFVVGDVIIEDHLKNAVAWKEAHPQGRAFLYTLPSNKNETWEHRCSWDEKDVQDIISFLDFKDSRRKKGLE